MSPFIKARFENRMDERKAVIEVLNIRHDHNQDGRLTRGEVAEILTAFQELEREKVRDASYGLRKRALYTKYFDINDDGVCSEVEDAIAYCFLQESRKKGRSPTNGVPIGAVWLMR